MNETKEDVRLKWGMLVLCSLLNFLLVSDDVRMGCLIAMGKAMQIRGDLQRACFIFLPKHVATDIAAAVGLNI